MDPTTVSLAARNLRKILSVGLPMEETDILIGHPSASFKESEGDTGSQYLNLFFYRIEPGVFSADTSSDDPFFIRMHCMITAIGNKQTGTIQVSAGENDLRLIGGVISVLSQHPFVKLHNDDDIEVAHLQLVLNPISLDDINHIWSTQGETSYRISVAYEMGIAPLPLETRKDLSPRVGIIGNWLTQGETEEYTQLPPPVLPFIVNTSKPDWLPHIAMRSATQLLYTTNYTLDSIPTNVQVLVAGKLGETTTLRWQQWSNSEGWQDLDDTQDVIISIDSIDPENVDPAKLVNVPLPTAITQTTQLILYAVRQWQRPDNVVVTLRSNPNLVSLYASGIT